MCATEGRSMSDLVRDNERVRRTDDEIAEGIERIVAAMDASIEAGLDRGGQLPGLGVPRRARDLAERLRRPTPGTALPPTEPGDWAGVYATAVNEENAAGGRIVTAPTNGAAGILPAVMRFMVEFCEPQVSHPRAEFLLTATAIGNLLKSNAGISGAELGCQGEVGSASAMAAAGLTAALGGTPEQVENAAEIAVEHSLGLTCDPVGGFVQVPCIERNAVGAVKAISASSLALRGDGRHLVSLDVAIETMRQTGRDMHQKYKETSLGGLAVNVPAC
jgi:L-serine dehydratase